MSSRYQLVVFDWEGTLSDPLGSVLHLLAKEAGRLGGAPWDERSARHAITLGIDKALVQLFPNATFHQQQQVLQAIQHAMSTRHHGHYLLPGAQTLVAALHAAGFQLAIATNKNARALQRALHVTGLSEFFMITRSAGQVPAKPCPQMLEEIMSHCVVSPAKTLMIGDSIADMEMAVRAGVSSIGVDFYHQSVDDLLIAGALDVVDDYRKIGQFLALPDY